MVQYPTVVAFLGVYICICDDHQYAVGCALPPVLGFDVGGSSEVALFGWVDAVEEVLVLV